ARHGHTATLLADGTVRISGGSDGNGAAVADPESFDPGTMRFLAEGAPAGRRDSAAPYVAASLPLPNAQDVPADATIALRFSLPVDVGSVSPATVTLSSSDGTQVITLTVAEGGRLAFAIPGDSLKPGT